MSFRANPAVEHVGLSCFVFLAVSLLDRQETARFIEAASRQVSLERPQMEHGTGGLRDPEQAHSYPATLGVREHIELIDPVAAKGNEADQTVEVASAPDIAVLDDTGPEESLVLFRRVPSGEPWQPIVVNSLAIVTP
jgi:hypothetical protein